MLKPRQMILRLRRFWYFGVVVESAWFYARQSSIGCGTQWSPTHRFLAMTV
jgi:hypothetical protein